MQNGMKVWGLGLEFGFELLEFRFESFGDWVFGRSAGFVSLVMRACGTTVARCEERIPPLRTLTLPKSP